MSHLREKKKAEERASAAERELLQANSQLHEIQHQMQREISSQLALPAPAAAEDAPVEAVAPTKQMSIDEPLPPPPPPLLAHPPPMHHGHLIFASAGSPRALVDA